MPNKTMPNPPEQVGATFDSYAKPLRARLLELRALILETASTTPGVGRVEEALRWGEPSYLTSETKSGSTIRIGPFKKKKDHFAMYVNCQTSLVETYRQTYPDIFSYSGHRAILFHVDDDLPEDELRHCIALALCYHLDKKIMR